jgi:hypothetical protein
VARLLIETAISGTDEAIPAEQRDYVRAIQAAPDAATKMARTEPELTRLWNEIAERRAVNMRRFVADLASVAALRLDPDQAADIVWATNAAEMYQLLVGQRLEPAPLRAVPRGCLAAPASGRVALPLAFPTALLPAEPAQAPMPAPEWPVLDLKRFRFCTMGT